MRATIRIHQSSSFGADTLEKLPAERVRFRPMPVNMGPGFFAEALYGGRWYGPSRISRGCVNYTTVIEIELDPGAAEEKTRYICEVEKSWECPGCEIHKRK